jgi:hypothetical protein
MRLLDERTADGSRHFARLPMAVDWSMVIGHASLLSGARIANSTGDEIASPWFDFLFRGHRFLVRSHEDHVRLSVSDPQCPDLLLFEVGVHFERLLAA